ncbi:pilus assembly protein TadG-related protein [Pseudorhodoplanes sp.]|uniref:TadE/TadG family type IV pilus assembly protein n=1 Tax=Pseudorhodoplanes sp. TaxID=1934341 RepID=UPI00391DFEDC
MINIIDVLRLLRQRAAGFRTDNSGNIATIFALATIPLIGAIGAAVDYSRGNSAKTSLQVAVDAAALALSREVTSLSEEQFNQKAVDYVKANLNRTDLHDLTVTPTFTVDSGGQIHIKAKAKIATTIAGILGVTEMEVGTDSTIKWGNTRLRVALVLDTTGSMNSAGKMTALKTAAKNMIDQLQNAATNPGDVLVSIVPFSKNVNVGSGNYNANWIDWTEWEGEPPIMKTSQKPADNTWYNAKEGSNCPFGTNTNGFGFRCVSQPQGTSNVNTIASSGNYSGLICPGRDGGNKISTQIGIIYNGCYNTWTKCVGSNCACTTTNTNICSCTGSGASKTCQTKGNYVEHTWRPTNVNATYTPALKMNGSVPYATPPRSTWTGCVTDRGTSSGPSDDYDRKVTLPSTGISASYWPAQQDFYCSPQVTALNSNWSGMKSTIDNLYPDGATNQPIGLVWGWQSLVGGGPFPTPPAKDPTYEYKEAIVLMSDGLNTLDRWYGNGSATNTNVDKRMYDASAGGAGTCKNVKAAGITIYAVHVNTDNDPMSTLLQSCASSPDKFWMVTSGSGLIDVFKQIGTELSQLRIVK